MRLRTRVAALAVAALASLGLAACGGDSGSGNGDGPLRVGASPVPHAEILRYVADELAPAQGLQLEIIEINDYVTPNTSLAEGSLDANYFQHVPYLEQFEADHGVDFEPVAGVHLEPLAAFSTKVNSLSELPDGATVAIPNDPTNAARALKLLADNGLLQIAPGTERTATVRDVVANPKNLQLSELEAAQLPRSLEDVDLAVINGNYALQAGLDPAGGSLAVESAENNPYTNVLVTRKELVQDPRVQKLAELLTSQQVRDYIQNTYRGAVIPSTTS